MISDGQVGCSLGNILALVCLCVNNKQRKVCFLSWSKLSSIAITLCVHSSWAQPASPHSVSAVRYSLANLSLHWVWGYWGVLCVLVRLEWGETLWSHWGWPARHHQPPLTTSAAWSAGSCSCLPVSPVSALSPLSPVSCLHPPFYSFRRDWPMPWGPNMVTAPAPVRCFGHSLDHCFVGRHTDSSQ